MNNAGIGGGGGPWENMTRRVIGVKPLGRGQWRPDLRAGNDWAEHPRRHRQHGFEAGHHNTTGDTAYNVSKAGVKVLTEAVAHELRSVEGCQITAHLLIPGFTFTGITGRPAKPPEAWSAEQVVSFMIEGMGRSDFYILCPDSAVTREMDEKCIQWAADDLIKNRPVLSRWHPDHREAFERFMQG